MTDLVDLMYESYSSRENCWAAVSRAIKKLATLKLIENKKRRSIFFYKNNDEGQKNNTTKFSSTL